MDAIEFEIFNCEEGFTPKITKDEYIYKSQKIIEEVNNIYLQNMIRRYINVEEIPNNKNCETCEDGCPIIINGEEYNCYTDRENGDCYIIYLDKDKYINEMEILLESDDFIDLLYTNPLE